MTSFFIQWFHDYRPMIRKAMRTVKYLAYLATIGRFLLTAFVFLRDEFEHV